MAKNDRKFESNDEMSLEDARKYRASLAKPEVKVLTNAEKREAFRIFWATEKYKYGKAKKIESIIWMHLTSMKMDDPSRFQEGLAHFGLKKIS